MDAVQKRLLKELRDSQREPNAQIEELQPVDDDNLFRWRAVILGQDDSPYAGEDLHILHGTIWRLNRSPGGRFVVDIEVPPSYPTSPPVMKFKTTVCHPNVHLKVCGPSGRVVCLRAHIHVSLGLFSSSRCGRTDNRLGKTGEICLDLLKTAWSPAWTLQSACLAVAVLLTQPEPNSPLNIDAGGFNGFLDTEIILMADTSANLLRCGDMLAYDSLIQYYVAMYAMA